MRLLFLSIVLCFSALVVHSQCSETDETKVLLVGDSWAFFMNMDQSINNAFDKWGHSNYEFFTNATLSENGAETEDFLQQEKLDEIEARLDSSSSIEAVHLSLGGNDVLGEWNVSYTNAQVDSLKREIFGNLDTIINFIKGVQPNVDVFWSGYAYPNFEEVIEDTEPFQTSHPFYGQWQDMGFPSFIEINTILNDFTTSFQAHADTTSRLHTVNATGLMQYTFGQPDSLGVPPGGTYPPFSVPLPQGLPSYPSPKESMRDYAVTKDAFHLSPEAYLDFVSYHTRKFYHKFLMDDQYFLPTSDSSKMGSVSASGTVSNSLEIGQINGEAFSSILSFPTSTLDDTTLAGASLFIRIEQKQGSAPLDGKMDVRVKNGYFGATAQVETGDYSAVGDAQGNACIFGSTDDRGHWVRLDLTPSMLPVITKNGPTQILLKAKSSSSGTVRFSKGANPEFAPVLNLDFGQPPNDTTTSARSSIREKSLSIYPNPVANQLHVHLAERDIQKVQLMNLLGKVVLEPTVSRNQINLSSLPKGVYLIQVQTREGRITKKIVKE